MFSPLHAKKSGKVFKGTKKDKRKIRHLIKQSEKNHNDDAFDATPFKKVDDDIVVDLSDDDELSKKYFKVLIY